MFVRRINEKSTYRRRSVKIDQKAVMVKMTESEEATWRIFTNIQKCIDNALGECYYNAKETSYELRKKWGVKNCLTR